MPRDRTLSPGVIDFNLSASYLCFNKTATRRTVTNAEKRAVYEAYGIPKLKRLLYRLDDVVPLSLGGMNVPKNLWPQPLLESLQKDRVENKFRKGVCSGKITLAAAQQYFLENY